MSLRPIRYSELGLLILLTAGALWLMHRQSNRPYAAASTLAGALFGGAAILLGNWINRSNEWKRAAEDLAQRRAKLKKLIGAELVVVATGYLNTKPLIDRALALRADDTSDLLSLPDGLTRFLPRGMPFTNSLGVELLTLEEPAIDALAIFQGSMTITRAWMERAADEDVGVGLGRLAGLSEGVARDMELLATCFELIAPTHKVQLKDKSTEIAPTLLRRMARSDGASPMRGDE